jgi:DNA mismatch endonuclease (patch repair protein)
MADIFTKQKRSEVMSKVSTKDTPQEIIVRKFLFANGFRYRKNYKRLPGSPDLYIPKFKIAIFVHGCFWHAHHCKLGRLPKSNIDFWTSKMAANKKRDRNKMRQLTKSGVSVLTIWQCQLKDARKMNLTLSGLLNKILKIIS